MYSFPSLLPFFLFSFFALLLLPLKAQNQGPEEIDKEKEEIEAPSMGEGKMQRTSYWEKNFSKEESYLVAFVSLSSISKHHYIVDGAISVHEVTVETIGSVTARFYYLEPITEEAPVNIAKNSTQRAKEAKDKIAKRVDTKDGTQTVHKIYPQTTHAHTVEFLLNSSEEVGKLYKEINKAWKNWLEEEEVDDE